MASSEVTVETTEVQKRTKKNKGAVNGWEVDTLADKWVPHFWSFVDVAKHYRVSYIICLKF